MDARLKLAFSNVLKRNLCQKLFFIDENKFNLHEPDGLRYYWQDTLWIFSTCKKGWLNNNLRICGSEFGIALR